MFLLQTVMSISCSSNPTLIGDTFAGFASASYQFYVADVGQTTAAYAHQFKKIGTLAFGVQHLNYGQIKSYDATGAEIGDYKSGESALFVSKSHQISNFRFGATLKMAFSSIAGYRANATYDGYRRFICSSATRFYSWIGN